MSEHRLITFVGVDGDYETLLATIPTIEAARSTERSGDDRYCVYTGGTTGAPKGVLWRQEDIFFAAMGGGDPFQFGNHITSPEQIVARIPEVGLVALSTPPFMHASGVRAGSGGIGRLARSGHVPIGYLGDPVKTAATFVSARGSRWALPGDLAAVEADGTIRILGRASTCINTGGEKVYAEEVESVLKSHTDVDDAVVVGVPDADWGQAVSAVITLRPSCSIDLEELRDFARPQLAGYKLPRRLVTVEKIVRSPSGKPDYRWAATVAAGGTP